jgi:uncharacterized protein
LGIRQDEELVMDPTDDPGTPDATKASDAPAHAPDSPDLFRQSDLIEVRRVENRGKGGRGVFARVDIPAGTVFERVPVILIPKNQVFGDTPEARRSARISWYVFTWIHPKREMVALSLGYGSIYNHSERANARYQMDLPDVMEYLSLRDIPAGEEITINYRGSEADHGDLGFEPDESAARTPAAS